MKRILKIILILTLTLGLLLTLTACGSTKYTKLGVTFEIPSRLEPRAVAGAAFAYGDDESFIVFTRRTKSELLASGLSELDVAEFTDRFLAESAMKDAVDVEYSTGRAEFSYVVEDPDNMELYYYYHTVVMKGADSIWIIQMSTYEALADKYIPKIEKWAASIVIE